MTSVASKNKVNEPRIGETAAMQPLSGTKRVDETFAVSGMGRAGFVRREETAKNAANS